MKHLGNTYGEVLSSLGQEERETLAAYISKCFDDLPIEELKDAQTNDQPYAIGGTFFEVEGEDDLIQVDMETGCSDLTAEASPYDIGYDLAMYLNKDETCAILMSCVSNSGGDVYIIPADILSQFPTIHSHIFAANNQ